MERLLILLGLFFCVANSHFVFPVHRNFKLSNTTLEEIKRHDSHRRLSAFDFPLGGDGIAFSSRLYYTKLGIGSPVKDYYLMVDTGSDLLWVDCVGCKTCPKNSSLGMDLTLYDPRQSKTSDLVSCNDDFCTFTYNGPVSGCKGDRSCPFGISYKDGTTVTGSYIKDYIAFNRINGKNRTVPESGTVIFGCGTYQRIGPTPLVGGILGFGHTSPSLLSQLAVSGKVKKIFSHCLDSINGGGIFSMGEMVAPKFNTIPLIPNMACYNLIMKYIEVDGEVIQLRMDRFDTGNGTRTLLDTGATLAYLPPSVQDQLLKKIIARQPGVKWIWSYGVVCFLHANDSLDGFPVVKLHFEGNYLTVHPRSYLVYIKGADQQCFDWGKTDNEDDPIQLGDLALSNKLVVYDLEKMVIGWEEFNCSTSINVKDDETRSVYIVGAKHLSPEKHRSSAFSVLIGRILTFVLLLIALVVT